ncbi:peptide deformylase [Sulfurovum sp. zt1-1]|uniref:Peptide deformylase n=1 Tax=Sulfurovum zhangzhouensis TaxID=3019067 RepID=A0ABT7QZN7_9BACT|nr:peptide deformylase [Sulfurovum zhangzhouensis]MDM5272299.1 peptide deformylase [Sulfurovum zhangzhouensis]
MVQKLVIYPDERVNIACTDVRSFNQTLWDVIEDIKDTMIKHNLDALAAIQIAYPYNIVLIKEADGSYSEYINPRIIGSYGKFDSIETTAYYPEITQIVPRAQRIKVIYEDRHGKPKSIDIDDEKYAATFQRKVDYLFGGTFLDKVSKAHRERVLEALKNNGLIPQVEICPTFSKKDYFVSFTDKLLFIMGLTLVSPFFNLSKETLNTLYTLDKFLLPIIFVLMIGFFFYAQYEAKKYSQCSSCQIGNNIGVIIKRFITGIVLAIGAYIILG